MDRDGPLDGPLDVLTNYLDKEIEMQISRKNSLESRSVGVITAAFAAVTVYFIVLRQTTPNPPPHSSGAHVAQSLALVLVLVAILGGLASIFPLRSRTLEFNAYRDTVLDIKAGMPIHRLQEDLIEVRVEVVKSLCHINDIKAILVILTAIAWVIAVASFTSSLYLTM